MSLPVLLCCHGLHGNLLVHTQHFARTHRTMHRQTPCTTVYALLLPHQVPETKCADLTEIADDVNLKLSLWQGKEEFEDLANTWRDSSFESLSVADMEDAVNRCVISRTLPQVILSSHLLTGLASFHWDPLSESCRYAHLCLLQGSMC